MNRLSLIILLILTVSFSFKGDVYKVFNKRGKDSSYEDLLDKAIDADIVLFGEMHNNPLCHWLEIKLAKDLYEKKKNDLILGTEMLEADDQVVLNEYFKSLYDYRYFKNEVKLPDNFETDYKPLLQWARENHLNFIATNVPRRYAGIVAKKGFASLDSLDNVAKEWMASFPIDFDPNLPGYKAMSEMGNHSGSMAFMAEAQALKDATMAFFILKNFKKDKLFFHINGSYHSDNYEGIVWYLKKKQPDLKILTVSCMESADLKLQKESENIADYIILIDEDLTKSY